MIEYFSHSESDFDNIQKSSLNILEYSKFFNKHYKLVARLEEKVTRHGHPSNLLEGEDLDFGTDLETQIEGINMIQLFSLAKRNSVNRYNAADSMRIHD